MSIEIFSICIYVCMYICAICLSVCISVLNLRISNYSLSSAISKEARAKRFAARGEGRGELALPRATSWLAWVHSSIDSHAPWHRRSSTNDAFQVAAARSWGKLGETYNSSQQTRTERHRCQHQDAVYERHSAHGTGEQKKWVCILKIKALKRRSCLNSVWLQLY